MKIYPPSYFGEGIHPTAIICEGAIIGEGTTVGPYSIVGPKVVLGKRNWIGPHAVVEGNTTLGDENKIFQFASIGSVPQDLKWQGTDTKVVIGNGNVFREYVRVEPGVEQFGGLTQIGNHNLLLTSSHIGHDCFVGDHNILTNGTLLAGHIVMGNRIIAGGMVGIHQFVRIGDFAFLGGGSMVVKDVPPFCMVQGDRAGLVGINKVGLLRAQVPADEVGKLRVIYRKLFMGKGSFQDRLRTLKEEAQGFSIGETFLQFIEGSQRGLTFPRKRQEREGEDEE